MKAASCNAKACTRSLRSRADDERGRTAELGPCPPAPGAGAACRCGRPGLKAALAHIRDVITDLAFRLARQYPALEELSGEMLANFERIEEIPPGGMDVPLLHDTVTDERHGLRVLWADHVRGKVSNARSSSPTARTWPIARRRPGRPALGAGGI
jgi:hypothetical protein